ncbi:MAG TPA: hypothetical protein VGO61_21285 [Steroidobacteraceae bacterium]|jgi:hypothetical protein|nr:hypothetical protein [Steroidobacteraceae bacterium]
MRVAVLGSWREKDAQRWRLLETQEAFAQACRRLGRELIESGHSLIVGTDALRTADGNAAAGQRHREVHRSPSRRERPVTQQ